MKAVVKGAGQTVRSFSTKSEGFVAQRAQYQAQISELRKTWQHEFQVKSQMQQQAQAVEKNRVVLERAIKLRELRKESKEKQAILKKQREEAYVRYQEKLANTHLLWEAKQKKKADRNNRLLKDLESDSQAFIAADQITKRITEDLFAKDSATTGYQTKYSNYWKYHVFTPKLGRLLSNDFREKIMTSTVLMDKLRAKSQMRIAKRVLVEDMMNQLIGSGKERGEFKSMVGEITRSLDEFGAFEDAAKVYDNDSVPKESPQEAF